MRRPLKRRICLLLGTIAPLSSREIQAALEELDMQADTLAPTVASVAVTLQHLRGMGVIRQVPRCSMRRGLMRGAVAWELEP